MLLTESLLGSSSAVESTFVEDVFSTWLYTGNGVGQNIMNGIQLGAGATSPGWIATLGGSSEGGNSVAADSVGNVYVCGSTFASGNNDLQIAKYSASGALQWQRRLGGAGNDSASSVAVDSAGNVYVCGSSTVSGNVNLQLVKCDTNGILQWQRSLSSPEMDFGNSVAVDSSGNVYVCGSHNISGRSTEFLIAKYNTNGVIQWQRSLGAVANDVGNSVAVDSSGNVYVCGSSNFAGIGNDDFQIAKYNTNGVIQWQRYLGSAFVDRGNSVSVDSVGNVYVCGESRAPAGINQFLIAKYNTNGVIQWQRSLGTSANSDGRGVAVDSSGNVHVCGSSNNDFQIAKYDTNGGLLWQRSLGSSTTEIGNSVAVDGSGNVYVAGYTAADGGRFLLARLPGDGSGSGSYTIGSSTFVYAPSFLTNATSSLTDAASSLTDVAGSLTDAASSLTDAASSLASSTTALLEGPGRGGLVWMKGRSGATDHALYDTARGATFDLASNLTSAQTTQSTGLTGFLLNGFSIGTLGKINTNAATYTSWTFREQPRFFDIVTYAGNGANRTIAHNLGSVPGCIMVKRLDASADWQVYHRSLANTQYMVLNSTAAVATGTTRWNSTTPTATEFSLGTDATVNASGGTYVAYLFAHDAGGFGTTGADNVISCGSYIGNGSSSGPVITLGYEPQWILVKRAGGPDENNWTIIDNIRGFSVRGPNAEDGQLWPNLPDAENFASFVSPTASGFQIETNNFPFNAAGSLYIYIAIRRGPMRTPTSGASVFAPLLSASTANTRQTTNFPVDLQIQGYRPGNNPIATTTDRLRSVSTRPVSFSSAVLGTSSTAAETGFSSLGETRNWDNTGYNQNSFTAGSGLGIDWNFRRAPGFFDVVCYTGTGTNPNTLSHNLTVLPELTIYKSRNSTGDWWVWVATSSNVYTQMTLNATTPGIGTFTATAAGLASTTFNPAAAGNQSNTVATNYIAYLFASCPGVSRVGSYTGTGSTQTINCGFSSGARFVLIKRTDSTGGWHVWDSARGIVAGNDPYLLLNGASAEVTNTDWVDPAASGFELSNAAGNLVNTNGGSYIFLAIA